MYANQIAQGRNWNTAESAATVNFGDCVRAELRWADGGYAYIIFDTKQGAVDYLNAKGFFA